MKKTFALLLSLIIVFTTVTHAFAADPNGRKRIAAETLYSLNLFNGIGKDSKGDIIFDLDRAPTRQEAITTLVGLLGKTEEAKSTDYAIPFTDVAEWAKPYVAYAYTKGYASGITDTSFGAEQKVRATQYITFVLRALGYEVGTDFQWDKAWLLSDKLGFTENLYNGNTKEFTRGDLALISRNALYQYIKGTNKQLINVLGERPLTEADIPLTEKLALYVDFGDIGGFCHEGVSFGTHSGDYYGFLLLNGKIISDYSINVPLNNQVEFDIAEDGTLYFTLKESGETTVTFDYKGAQLHIPRWMVH